MALDTNTYRVRGGYFHCIKGRDASAFNGPGPFITVIEAETITEETYHILLGSSPHFPWNPLDEGKTRAFFDWVDRRTEALQVPNPIYSTGCFHDSIEAAAVGGVQYEAEVANALWNVKTWRIAGTVGGVAINAVIPAGTTSNGVDLVDEEDRPNDGKRGVYTTTLSFSSEEGSAFVVLNSPAEMARTSSGTDTPRAFVPVVRFSIQEGDTSAMNLINIQSEDELVEYASKVSLFGKPIPTYAGVGSTGAPAGSLAITVEEWWTNELWAS